MKRSKLMKGLALSSLLFVMAACANGEGEEESAEAETNTEGGEDKIFHQEFWKLDRH